jgi:excisionase family DNA binding protein
MDRLLTVKQAASYLAIAVSHVYSLMERGELPYIKIGSSRRLHPQDLQQFIASRTIGKRAA